MYRPPTVATIATPKKISIENFEETSVPIDSPRTIEACMMCGIDVDDLYPKVSGDLMTQAGYKHHIADVLADHYEARRQEYITEVTEARRKLIVAMPTMRLGTTGGFGATGGSGAGAAAGSGGTGTPTKPPTAAAAGDGTGGATSRSGRHGSDASGAAAGHGATAGSGGLAASGTPGGGMGTGTGTGFEAITSAAIERERKRAAFLKEKQRAEMEALIEGEIKLAKLAESNMMAERAARAAEAKRKADIAKQREKAMEERRKREEKRREEADERVELMRKQAADAFAAEAAHLKEEEAAHKVLMAKWRAEEDERRMEQAEADREREREIEAQAVELERRLVEWEGKEEERQAKREAFKRKMQEESDAKAAKAAARLDAALSRDAELMAKKRRDFEHRVAEAEARRLEKLHREEVELAKRAAARATKTSKMRGALVRAREDELKWTEDLAVKASREGDALERVRADLDAKMHEKGIREVLHAYDKAEAVRRQKRKDEYKRMQTLLRMMSAEQRLDAEAAERAKHAAERQALQKKLLYMKHVAETELTGMRTRGNFSGLGRLLEKTVGASARGRSGSRDEGGGDF